MLGKTDRKYRNWLAYMGLYHAMRNDQKTSEHYRLLVRRMDHSKRFRLKSLN